MTLVELKIVLETTGLPVAYFEFVDSIENPVPDPPYIVYLEAYSSNFMADNKVYKKYRNIQVELYTKKKDLAAEGKVEKVLDDYELPYQTIDAKIESENLFQRIYEIKI